MKRLLPVLALLATPAFAAGPWYVDAETVDNQVLELVLYDDADNGNSLLTTLTSEDLGLTVQICDNVGANCTCLFDSAAEFEPIDTFGLRDTTIGPGDGTVMQIEHRNLGEYQVQIPKECFAGIGAERGKFRISGAGVYPMDIEIVMNAITLAEIKQQVTDACTAFGGGGCADMDTLVAVLTAVGVVDTVVDGTAADVLALDAGLDDGTIGVKLDDASIGPLTFAAGAIDAAAAAADLTTELQTGLATAAALTTVDTVVDGIATAVTTVDTEVGNIATAVTALPADTTDAVWDEAIAGHVAVGSTGKELSDAGAAGTPPTVGEISDGVWEEAQIDHATAGTFGELATESAAILVDTGTTLDGKVDAIGTDVDAVLADTGTDGVVLVNDAITAAKIATDASTELVAAIAAMVVDGTITLQQALSLSLSRDIGPWTNDGDPNVGPYCYEDPTGTTDRFCVTLDPDASRVLDSTAPYTP